jgi:hypothetical protein
MPVTSELGSSESMQEPMDKSVPVAQESIDDQLLEDIYQIISISVTTLPTQQPPVDSIVGESR